VQVFHAGTKRSSTGELTTAGGRVFSVAAYGSSLQDAVSSAYEGVKSLQFNDMFYRKDIASRYEPVNTLAGRDLLTFTRMSRDLSH
jgi:phosphoribosylamine--glycine ligase/phosphoribosylformylglycinamidine cyclo-ligase